MSKLEIYEQIMVVVEDIERVDKLGIQDIQCDCNELKRLIIEYKKYRLMDLPFPGCHD